MIPIRREVEAVSIPADAHEGIPDKAKRVLPADAREETNSELIDADQSSLLHIDCQVRPPPAVLGIVAVVLPHGVVEEGE